MDSNDRSRVNLVRYLESLGGKPEEISWAELEEKFGIDSYSGSEKGNKAKKFWRYFKSTGKYVPENTGSSNTNLTLKSTWQVQKKGGDIVWLESYQNNVTQQHIREFRSELIKDLEEFSPSASTFIPSETDPDKEVFLLEISIPDVHIGREPYEETRTRYMKTLSRIVEDSNPRKIERILYVTGNDYFNTDNTEYKTTKGTQQFDFMDWRESFRRGRDLLIESIEYLKRLKVPIDIENRPGNHDMSKMFYLGDLINAYYRNDDQVHVRNVSGSYSFYQYGNCMFMFEHGELKPADYPLIMATEQPLMWAQTKFRECHTGHLHHEILKDFRGVKVRYFPSISTMSEWEKKSGFGGRKEAVAYLWNKDEGLRGSIFVTI